MRTAAPAARSAVAAMSAFTIAFTIASSPAHAAPCTPTLKWRWDGPTRFPANPAACTLPLVARLTDKNADGRIDDLDTPDVVFTVFSNVNPLGPAYAVAIDGETGADVFTSSEPIHTRLAVADLDRDGVPEVIGHRPLGLVVLDNAGARKWFGDLPPSPPESLGGYEPIAVADLDQDGSPEVVAGSAVFAADGTYLWWASAGRGASVYDHMATPVDLVPSSPGLEVLAGNTAYDPAGGIVWRQSALPDGHTAVADFDGDGDPEIVLAVDSVIPRLLYLLDHLGNPLASPLPVDATNLTPPVAADLDGDGQAEVFLVTGADVVALEWTPAGFVARWATPIVDESGLSGGTAYDLDGDGAAEVLYRDELDLQILDGRTGAVIFRHPSGSATDVEYPLVADVDGDCRPEILVTACGGGSLLPGENAVLAFDCDSPTSPRPVWNQAAYHVTNVNDDASVPRVEPAAFGAGWMAQQGPLDVVPLSDVGNLIRAVKAGVEVRMTWAGAPPAFGFVLYRSEVKESWPPAPEVSGLRAPETALADVPSPPPRYFYRVAEVSCSGIEGP